MAITARLQDRAELKPSLLITAGSRGISQFANRDPKVLVEHKKLRGDLLIQRTRIGLAWRNETRLFEQIGRVPARRVVVP